MSCARGRVDGAVRSAADRCPMGQALTLAPETAPARALGSDSGRRAQGAGRCFVNAVQRVSLAGFARGVSVAVDLVATVAGLGGARDLAPGLAGVSGRIE